MALSESGGTRATPPTSEHIPYLVGLDGLRALAVVAVLLYHAGYQVVGGYLGVESFFVLSGFLITTLLIADQERHGKIRLGMFWLRRARRLLPALILTLLGTFLLSAILAPGDLGALGGDSLAALLYVMNWKLIVAQQAYFDPMSRPPLLQHLWSLAIEEQFYLLWPLACVLGLGLRRRLGFLAAVLVAALGSGLLMSWLYSTGAEVSRIYYGTDTRAAGLLIGAALALVWTQQRRESLSSRSVMLLEGAGIVALLLMLAAYVWLHEQDPLLYYGGFALVSLATALVIAAVTAKGTRWLPALLENGPMRWIGHRSYSLYLWHWPIFLLIAPPISEPWTRWAADGLRFGLTILLAAASYRFIERPIRTHGFKGAWAMLGQTSPQSLARSVFRPGPALLVLPVVLLGALLLVWQPSSQATGQVAMTALPEAPLADATASLTARDTPVHLQTEIALEQGSALAGGPTATPGPPTPTPMPTLDAALTGELQTMLDDMVASSFVPGVEVSVSVPGYGVWDAASGIADMADGRAMNPDTPVRIASVSKMFTAVVVLQLVEEGSLTLDQPVATWLPEALPYGDRITVRQLLQHTAGLYDYLEDRIMLGEMQRNTSYEWTPQELVDYAADFPQRTIGRWDYSSTHYVVLGMLVEQVTGNSLAQEVRQRIFDPLEMQQAAFLPQEEPPALLAHGYSYENDLTSSSMSFAFGTGNLAMTTGDLNRFGQALFTGDLLAAETREIMLGEFVSGRGQYDMPDLAYGLGVMRNRLPIEPIVNDIQRHPDANLVLGHIGGYGGFRSAIWYAPNSGIVITVGLNQAQVDPNNLATAVLDRVLASLGQ